MDTRPPDFECASVDETGVENLAHQLADRIVGGEVLLLEGELGAGKTFFTRAFAQGLGIASGVNSPTYVLMCSHATPKGLALHHLDFYRLEGTEDTEELGLDELITPGSIVIAEWPDRCPGAFHEWTLRLRFKVIDDAHRQVRGWWGALPFKPSELAL